MFFSFMAGWFTALIVTGLSVLSLYSLSVSMDAYDCLDSYYLVFPLPDLEED